MLECLYKSEKEHVIDEHLVCNWDFLLVDDFVADLMEVQHHPHYEIVQEILPSLGVPR